MLVLNFFSNVDCKMGIFHVFFFFWIKYESYLLKWKYLMGGYL